MEFKNEPEQSSKNCFTCLRQSEKGMQISSAASDPESVTVVKLLTKHFWFKQDDFNEEQHVICWGCWNRLDEFHRFYQEVEQNHRSLNQKPPKVSGCEPKLVEDEDSNDVYEIQHDEVVVKDENWVESEEEGSGEEFEPESFSDEENSVEGECEPEELPLEKLLPRSHKAKQESWIGVPVDTRQANNLVRDVKQRVDDDEFIKTHVQYICSVCKNNYSTFWQLTAHMMNMHNMKSCITCCGNRYYKKLELLEHVQRLQDPDRFKCDICHKILTNSTAVRKHKREMHATDEEKIYHCDRCPRRFAMAKLLEYHLKGHAHLEKGTFKCLHCERPFTTMARKNSHIKAIHAAQVQCDICQKWLKNNHSWKVHYRRHKDHPVPCDICAHVALNSVALSSHKRLQHFTEPSFVCEKCGKKFQRANELKTHRFFHYEGTLYPCNLCGKNFTHQGNMKKHQRMKHPKECPEQNNELKDAQ